MRDTVAQDLSGTGRALYEIGNDTVDNLFKDGVAEAVGMPWLGVTGAYGEAARKATMYGGTTEESNLLGMAKLTGAAANELLRSMGKEAKTWQEKTLRAGKEALNDYAYEQLKRTILNEEPEYARRVALLIQEGVPQEAAAEQVLYQMMLERIG